MKIIRRISIALMSLLLCSCTVRRVLFFQDTHNGYQVHVDSIQEVRLQPGDRLSVYIKSKTPELSSQVSLYMSYSATSLATGGSLSNNYGGSSYGGYGNNNISLYYTVLPDGTIEMPVVGFLKVQGMTRVEVQNLIQKVLRERNLVQDAIVVVNFLSQTYTVINGAGGGGQHSFSKDYLTIVDAVAEAGVDMQSRRNDIRVFRQDSTDSMKVYTINFLSADSVYASPVYYVKPNDVIYIVPTKNKMRGSTPNGTMFQSYGFWVGSLGTVMSLITTVMAFAALFKK